MSTAENEGRLSFLTPNSVGHGVNGKTLQFYPVSIRVLFKLRCIAKPLAKSIALLFGGNSDRTSGSETRDFYDDNTGERGSETRILPIDPALAELRLRKKVEAAESIVEALTDDDNRLVVGEIIMDSLRDSFQRNPSREDIERFMDNEDLDISTLVALLVGVGKANKKVFGPLGEAVSGNLKELISLQLETAVAKARAQTEEIPETEEDEQTT